MAKNSINKLGGWAFLIGVVLAVVLGIFMPATGLNNYWVWALVAIGLIVGFVNVTGSEAAPFLLSGTALVIVSAFGASVLGSIDMLSNIMATLLTVFVPATIIVAIKNVFSLAKN